MKEFDLNLYFILQYLENLQSYKLPKDIWHDIDNIITKISKELFKFEENDCYKIKGFFVPYEQKSLFNSKISLMFGCEATHNVGPQTNIVQGSGKDFPGRLVDC